MARVTVLHPSQASAPDTLNTTQETAAMHTTFERRPYQAPTLTPHGSATEQTCGVGYGRTEASGWQNGRISETARPAHVRRAE
jgi:hypothetical protein